MFTFVFAIPHFSKTIPLSPQPRLKQFDSKRKDWKRGKKKRFKKGVREREKGRWKRDGGKEVSSSSHGTNMGFVLMDKLFHSVPKQSLCISVKRPLRVAHLFCLKTPQFPKNDHVHRWTTKKEEITEQTLRTVAFHEPMTGGTGSASNLT